MCAFIYCPVLSNDILFLVHREACIYSVYTVFFINKVPSERYPLFFALLKFFETGRLSAIIALSILWQSDGKFNIISKRILSPAENFR